MQDANIPTAKLTKSRNIVDGSNLAGVRRTITHVRTNDTRGKCARNHTQIRREATYPTHRAKESMACHGVHRGGEEEEVSKETPDLGQLLDYTSA